LNRVCFSLRVFMHEEDIDRAAVAMAAIAAVRL
jgi:hypothetical protein